MTSTGDWDPSIMDDPSGFVDQRLKQLLTTPIYATDDFYSINGNIVIQKSERKIKQRDRYISLDNNRPDIL